MTWWKTVVGFLAAQKKTLGMVAVPVVLVLIGVAVARTVDANDETRQIAVYSAVVATFALLVNTAKNAYDVWDKEQERQKKQADKQEKIRATFQYRMYEVTAPVLGVEVYNEGTTTVAIKRVVVVVVTERGPVGMGLMHTVPNAVESEAFGRKMKFSGHDYRVKLEPKDHAEFHEMIPNKDEFAVSKILELPPDKVWIVIESFQGEVARVPGVVIQAGIRKVLQRAS